MAETRGAAFVPIPTDALDALEGRANAIAQTAREARRAVHALTELATDYRSDAVRRLQERGASEAQVERYEASLDAALRTVREPMAELERACAALRADVDALK